MGDFPRRDTGVSQACRAIASCTEKDRNGGRLFWKLRRGWLTQSSPCCSGFLWREVVWKVLGMSPQGPFNRDATIGTPHRGVGDGRRGGSIGGFCPVGVAAGYRAGDVPALATRVRVASAKTRDKLTRRYEKFRQRANADRNTRILEPGLLLRFWIVHWDS